VLGADGPFPPLPGLDPEEPISASALQVLLACPRRFLMERVLGWDEPAGAPTLTELDPLAFGTLVHRVHEELYRAHGAEIDERRRTLEAWLEVASAAADSAFDAFLREHPLPGAEVRKRERERVRDAIRAFVEYDWKSAPARRFGGVEIGFGYDQPVALEVGGAPVYVGGFIDRLDVEGAALVRDLKTGRPHPRVGDEAAPTPELDVQLGLYVLALKKGLSRAWNLPWGTSAAYVYVGRGDPVERAFRGNDALRLLQLAPEWLATGVALLRERAFLSTPHADDCIYCPFKPVCGAEAPRRAAACLAGLDDDAGALGRFRALKAGDDEEERP
jgi:RecB family exonuclease